MPVVPPLRQVLAEVQCARSSTYDSRSFRQNGCCSPSSRRRPTPWGCTVTCYRIGRGLKPRPKPQSALTCAFTAIYMYRRGTCTSTYTYCTCSTQRVRQGSLSRGASHVPADDLKVTTCTCRTSDATVAFIFSTRTVDVTVTEPRGWHALVADVTTASPAVHTVARRRFARRLTVLLILAVAAVVLTVAAPRRQDAGRRVVTRLQEAPPRRPVPLQLATVGLRAAHLVARVGAVVLQVAAVALLDAVTVRHALRTDAPTSDTHT